MAEPVVVPVVLVPVVRCGDCKHWQESHEDRSYVLQEDAGFCRRIGNDLDQINEPRIDARFDSGFGRTEDAVLVTPPGFGCVLGELKQEPTP